MRRHAVLPPSNGLFRRSKSQKSTASHIELYQKLYSLADWMLPVSDSLLRPTLWAWEYHSPNVLVSNGRAVCITDWQQAWVGPLFFQAGHPRLIDPANILSPILEERVPATNDREREAAMGKQAEKSMALDVYESQTERFNSPLHRLFNLPQWDTRRDLLEVAEHTWEGDLFQFRDHLIRTFR